jgi:protein-L-isoaspartate(D-aspartate) O-methyltransferase
VSGAGTPARKFPLRLDRIAGAAGATSRTAEPGGSPLTAVRPLLRPQRQVANSHADARQRSAPAGLGLDSAGVRARMVERLRAGGITHEAVLAAFERVPRHAFVDGALVTQAYEDTSLPIGHGQTISKPSVVARMIELLYGSANARASGRLLNVLEIGTGCGYQAALLGTLARSVTSIERLKPLHDKARELLAPLRTPNLRLVFGDGMLGHAPNAPYDAIIAAAGGAAVPQAWLDQLADGGRLVSPVRDAGGDGQVLTVIDRHAEGYRRSVHEAVKFVPLKSGLAR